MKPLVWIYTEGFFLYNNIWRLKTYFNKNTLSVEVISL